MIRDADLNDAGAIADIYNYYVESTVISFEELRVDAEEVARRISGVQPSYPWLVLEQAGELLGYAYATAWRPRSAYRFSVETSVYLKQGYGGGGLGSALYRDLLARLKNMGYHSAFGGITLPNPVSVALHEKFGFRRCGELKEVGYKFGRWLDVGYWQLRLD